MNLSFRDIGDRGPSTHNATSVCLYRSDMLKDNRHVQPLLRHLYRDPEKITPANAREFAKSLSRDLIIFCDRNEVVPALAAIHPQTRVFEVEKPPEGHGRHFMRYLSCDERFIDYQWIWFTGTDTLESPARYDRMESLASGAGCQWVVRCSSTTVCCPNLRARVAARRELFRELAMHEATETDWSCDDRFFNEYFLDPRRQALPQLLNTDGNGPEHPRFEAHVKSLLDSFKNNIIASL